MDDDKNTGAGTGHIHENSCYFGTVWIADLPEMPLNRNTRGEDDENATVIKTVREKLHACQWSHY